MTHNREYLGVSLLGMTSSLSSFFSFFVFKNLISTITLVPDHLPLLFGYWKLRVKGRSPPASGPKGMLFMF